MEKEIVKSIVYRDDHGMDIDFSVGRYGVLSIVQHTPRGEGDKWYYDVVFENSIIQRLFTFDRVVIVKE